MNTKDTFINDNSLNKLIHSDNYYRAIFKKTEKIVSVVFYILNNIDHTKKSETHTSNLASKAHLVHEHALRSLEARESASREVLEQFAQALIGLDSTVRVVQASTVITPEVASVVLGEIDTVLRGLSSYIGLENFSYNEPTVASRSASAKPTATPSVASPVSGPKPAPTRSNQPDRRERIKTILEAKGDATIKDISEIITDVSEKTIQRELNAMIEDNIVKRQGERRWSKYSIF